MRDSDEQLTIVATRYSQLHACTADRTTPVTAMYESMTNLLYVTLTNNLIAIGRCTHFTMVPFIESFQETNLHTANIGYCGVLIRLCPPRG